MFRARRRDVFFSAVLSNTQRGEFFADLRLRRYFTAISRDSAGFFRRPHGGVEPREAKEY